MLRRLVSCAALVLVGLVNSPAVGAFADPLLPVPTAADLSTSNPSSSCATSPDDAPFVNLNTITGPVMNIRTTVAVTEVVTATVELWQRDGAAPLFTSTSSTVVSSTGPGTVRVGFRFDPPLADGEYFWRARVTDAESGPEVPWSPSCYLNHDATRPAAPVISSTDFPSGQVGLGVGRKGTFRLAASDADVIGFEYTFGSIIPVGGPILPVGPDGSATITFVPIETGPGDVVARTVDRAGNRSAQTEYHFFVGVASGPAAVWHFDDGSGTVAAGDPGPAGTLTGGAAFSTDGKVGGAVRLDGTSGYVSTPLTLGTGTTFAVSAWVRLADTRQDQPVLAEGDASGDSFSLSYRADLAHWTFSATAATATTDVAVSAASPERGEWTHLAGVYDGYSLRLYVDGHADGVVGHPAPAPAKGTVQVGSDPAVADRFLAGEVDEVRVFDRAVFPGELHAMVNADDTATPVGVWHFDDTVGHVAADSSSGDHPIVRGNASFTPDGQFGAGVLLDGSTAMVSTLVPVLRTDRSFTVGVWVKLAAPGAATVLSAETNSGTVLSLWFEPSEDYLFGLWHFGLRGADGTMRDAEMVAFEDPTGNWTHLAATWDEFTGEMRLQIRDPVGIGLAVGTQYTPDRATTGIRLGADPANPDQGRLTGVLDELRIYQGAMSQTQLNNLPTIH